MVSNDPAIFQEFRNALGTRDPKTVAAYLTTMRDFVTWLAELPGGTPFHLGWASRNGRAPRTREPGAFWVASVLPMGDG